MDKVASRIRLPHFIEKTAFPVQKTGKVSDWYQSDNYL